jgi:hypothetical protein
MQPQSYEVMGMTLEKLGLTGQMQNEEMMNVSSQVGPVYPDRGNSFWLSRRDGVWYLSTSLPAGDRVLLDQDVGALCEACVGSGPSAMYRVPPELIARFKLGEIDNNQYRRLFPRD